MAVPSYDEMMLPILKMCSDGREYTLGEAKDKIINIFGLCDDDIEERTPSDKHTLLYVRICWAKTYLKKAGLIEQKRRGHFSLTKTGAKVLIKPPDVIDKNFLLQFEGFREFSGSASEKEAAETDKKISIPDKETPEEQLDRVYTSLIEQIKKDLLDYLKNDAPLVLENTVIDLMIAMGYGDSANSMAKALGRTGDRGVDGVIHMDKLGLDRIYIQAKRYQNSVGSPDVRNFVGALEQHKATKGVFITTGTFTAEAMECASSISKRVVLIDGNRLADLMLTHAIGVNIERTLNTYRIDTDYFDQF